MTIRFAPPATAAAATALTKATLATAGTLVKEGDPVTGPTYKAIGYNIHVIPGVYATGMTLDTQAKLDDFFSKQQPNSLHRMEAFAPGSGSGHTDAAILAIIANAIATARKYGQRLILRTTNWTTVGSTPGVVDRYDNKSSTWFTSFTYKKTVTTGGASFEDWIVALLGVCGTDGTVPIIDILNEPQCSSGNAASAAAFVAYMAAAIKAVDPGKLVMMGVNVVGVVGGASSYATIAAGVSGVGLDIYSSHNYNSYGFPTNTDPIVAASQTAGKPYLCDEHSQLGKAYFGLTSDSDKDANGWPAVDFEAQGREIDRFIASNLAISNCMGVLIYSWPGTQTDGLGHNEPPEGSLGRKLIREASLRGDGFSFESLPSISAWMDGAQNWRYAPKAAVTTWWYRHQNGGSGSITSGTAPTAGRLGTHASFRFDGTKFIDQTPFKTGSAAATGFWALAPTIWPAAGSYMYLTGPQASTGLASGVRINSAGQVEVIKTSATNSTAGTVVCTSTNSVDRDAINTLAWQWDPVGGTVAIYLNGVLTTATGQTASLTSGNARIGLGYDGLNGFVGHVFEIIQEVVYETASNIGLALAYFHRRYKTQHAVGVPIDFINQQVATVATPGQPMSLTGATAATRYVGGTASGAPTSGTFAVGDFVIDQAGKVWVCTSAGTPGTWTATARSTMLKATTASFAPSATLNTYGTGIDVTPDAGFVGFTLAAMTWLPAAGSSGETLTCQVTATYDDNSTLTSTFATVLGNVVATQSASDSIRIALFKDGRYIKKLTFQLQSTVNSSAATGTARVAGQNIA